MTKLTFIQVILNITKASVVAEKSRDALFRNVAIDKIIKCCLFTKCVQHTLLFHFQLKGFFINYDFVLSMFIR